MSHQKCILATKEEWYAEELMDADENDVLLSELPSPQRRRFSHSSRHSHSHHHHRHHHKQPKGSTAWYNSQSPPFALWVCGRDNLVDGDKILRRFERGREPHARLVHRKVIPAYEHLDVIWAMDAEDEVFREVREVLWRTASAEDRARCRVPKGCEEVERWVDDRQGKKEAGGQRDGEEGHNDNDEDGLVLGDDEAEEDEDQEMTADPMSSDDEETAQVHTALLSSGRSRSSSTSSGLSADLS